MEAFNTAPHAWLSIQARAWMRYCPLPGRVTEDPLVLLNWITFFVAGHLRCSPAAMRNVIGSLYVGWTLYVPDSWATFPQLFIILFSNNLFYYNISSIRFCLIKIISLWSKQHAFCEIKINCSIIEHVFTTICFKLSYLIMNSFMKFNFRHRGEKFNLEPVMTPQSNNWFHSHQVLVIQL